ncbi:50S ribosomal protein L35 [Corynebacterium cystitidis]|uniref:Large ribosomal subunit protein bL35 n=1 Tax=Corynebacterium cystitidis DSM 20524 TaxID=1121357 RepID=A0A1H9VAD8_9CORY|nr:50S ribosomal protein L35 [Corynebacterium cystitidis]WJY82322.1 50S ribosomal protein L35 [Corynebacterium cystitidis DSM 20524]SES18780.1 LSU ribosomal protein L35P [Corynebacterium cystitidis DSM 20524]SNV76486.1 50S ribosomal protein L35 [Corynebacterium cystitidis]
MKQKTHKGTAKRIKVSGSGKLRRYQAGKKHLNEHKTSKRVRQLKNAVDVSPKDVPRMKKLLRRA